MEKITDVAKYISKKYFAEKKENIDQLKLQKMAFFVQKESFSRNGKEMFEEDFEGWKYGPVCREIRNKFKEIQKNRENILLNSENKEIIDFIFEKYKDINSYRLSYLTHLEFSWIKSRIGIESGKNGNVIIDKKDIALDAKENII